MARVRQDHERRRTDSGGPAPAPDRRAARRMAGLPRAGAPVRPDALRRRRAAGGLCRPRPRRTVRGGLPGHLLALALAPLPRRFPVGAGVCLPAGGPAPVLRVPVARAAARRLEHAPRPVALRHTATARILPRPRAAHRPAGRQETDSDRLARRRSRPRRGLPDPGSDPAGVCRRHPATAGADIERGLSAGDTGGAQRPEGSRPLPAPRFPGHRTAAAGSGLVRRTGRGGGRDARGDARIGARNPGLGGGPRDAAARAVRRVALVPARPVLRPPGQPAAGESGRLVPRLRPMVPGGPVRGGGALAGGAPGLARPDCLPRGLPARRGLAERLVLAAQPRLAGRRADVRCGRSDRRAAARLRPRHVPAPSGRGNPPAGLSRRGTAAHARPAGSESAPWRARWKSWSQRCAGVHASSIDCWPAWGPAVPRSGRYGAGGSADRRADRRRAPSGG